MESKLRAVSGEITPRGVRVEHAATPGMPSRRDRDRIRSHLAPVAHAMGTPLLLPRFDPMTHTASSSLLYPAASFCFSAIAGLLLAAPVSAQNHAIALNGIDAYGTAAGVGGLVTNSTWEAWVRLPASTTTTGFRPVLYRQGLYDHLLPLDVSTGQIRVDMYSCGGACSTLSSSPGSLQTEHWHHIALVYGPEAGPSCTAFLDGEQVAFCGPQACATFAGFQTLLGAWGYMGPHSFLHATIDEARISDIPRYSGSFTPERRFFADANTAGLWHFDEGQGGMAMDSSPHARHFTLHGGYQWTTGNSTATPAWISFGNGCAGPEGTPHLAPQPGSTPRLGTTFKLDFVQLPDNYVAVPLGFLGFGNTDASGAPLAIYGGSPTCMQSIDLTGAYVYPLANLGGRTEWHIPLPNTPFLDGASVYVQGIVFDWSLPFALPALTSNAGEMVLGF